MAHELSTNCCIGTARLLIEVREKVKAKYGKVYDSLSKMYARAIEDSVQDVELPPETYEKIAKEIRKNKAKRELARGVNK